ncbi:MAG: hypothetical protein EHM20_01690 [Alphaproteobacteria bacterium]|nr:MAG: hypothetical protein EHM20_01690 [Alphaproteobacteria bacterium]
MAVVNKVEEKRSFNPDKTGNVVIYLLMIPLNGITIHLKDVVLLRYFDSFNMEIINTGLQMH